MEAKELKTKTSQELLKKINDLKAELFTLRFQNSTGELDQPHKIKVIKRDIARIFTELVRLQKQTQKDVKAHLQVVKKTSKSLDKTSQKSAKKRGNAKSKEEAS